MDIEKAKAIAQEYLDNNPLPSEDYKWVLSEPVKIPEGWYFDHNIFPERPKDAIPLFGGALGYKVLAKDGTVVDVCHEDFLKLRENF